jgi:hypothetical protein
MHIRNYETGAFLQTGFEGTACRYKARRKTHLTFLILNKINHLSGVEIKNLKQKHLYGGSLYHLFFFIEANLNLIYREECCNFT